MKLVQVAEQNKPYYSADYTKGFNDGAKAQYEADKREAERHGRWEYGETTMITVGGGYLFGQGYRCSVCHKPPFIIGGTLVKTDYCPWCGVKMEGEEE